MRPAWQIFQARELAGRMGSTYGSHMAAALIVRDVLANTPGLDRAMLTVPQTTSEEYLTAEHPEIFVQAMQRMFDSVGVRTAAPGGPEAVSDTEQVARAMWTRARTAYLRLPRQEIEAAREISRESRKLVRYGAAYTRSEEGRTEEIWGGDWVPSAWEGFGVLGSLLDELLGNMRPEQRADFSRAYEEMNTNTAARRDFVRRWQRVMQSAGLYDGILDGLWGPKSETAFITVRPTAYGIATKLIDVQAFLHEFPDLEDADVIGSAISRDRWVAANPDKLPPRPVAEEEPSAAPGTVPEETLVLEPEGEPVTAINGEAQRVEIVLPTGETESVTVVPVDEELPKKQASVWPWIVGGVAVAGIMTAVVATRSKSG